MLVVRRLKLIVPVVKSARSVEEDFCILLVGWGCNFTINLNYSALNGSRAAILARLIAFESSL